MKNTQEYIEQLEAALIDALEGESPHDIFRHTKISFARCQEISNLMQEVLKNYKEKHGI